MSEPFFNERNINLYIGTEIEDGTKPVEIALNGITLINKKEFLDWMRPDVPKTSNRNVAGVEIAEMEEIVDINNEILQNLASEVCNGIIEQYGQETMDLLINSDSVDILVAVENNYENLSYGKTKTVANNKIKKIVGFIIVEHGECKSKPNLFCVKLICVKPNSGFNGKILMGAYLFCIKISAISEKYGILELAKGYTNVGGFISYMKMGFKPDLKLSNSDCFEDYNNLPMIHDIRGMRQQDIVKYATNVAEIIPHDDESGVFRVYEHFKTLSPSQTTSLKPILMRLLLLNNLLYKSHVEGGFENLQNEDYKFELKPEERVLFYEMMQMNPKYSVAQFQTKITGERDTVLSEILSSRKGGSKKSRKRSRKQQTNTRKHRIKRFRLKV